MMKVLVTEPLHAAGQAIFDDHPHIETLRPEALTEEALIDAVRDVEGIAVRSAKLNKNVIDAATGLRAVSRHGVGYDNIDLATLNQRNIPLLLAIHANAVSVAEHTMLFLLYLAKRGRLYDSAARQSDFKFRNAPVAIDIAAKSLTIIGFGRIGTRLARRALAFDMRVFVYDPYVDRSQIEAAGCVPVADLHSVLPTTDFLTVHCPLNSETHYMVSTPELILMPPGSFVINCARGGIVDESALVHALESGQIAGAGIDVYEQEPPPADHPFLVSENVILSTHSAGVSVEAAKRMSCEAADNLVAALENRLDHEVLANPEIFKQEV